MFLLPSCLLRIVSASSAVACFVSSATAQDDEPIFYGIQKGLYYVQTSAAGPALSGQMPARFETIGVAAGSLRLPSGTVMNYGANAGVDQRFATAAAMDAAFPAGAYTLAVGSVSGIAMTMPADPYPAEIPRVLNGTWSGGRLVVDPTKDYTIVFNAFSNYAPPGGLSSSNVHIYLVNDDENDLVTVQRSNVEGHPSFTTVTIPAGTLVAGRTYTCETSRIISPILNTTSVPGALGVVIGIYEMDFEIAAVNPPNSAPVITTQPVAQSIASHGTVVFSVAADAFPVPTYQWQRGTTPIAGETRSTLVLNGAAASAGNYRVVVTNSQGSATSVDAALTVNTFAPSEVGRLVNVSILNATGPGAAVLNVGATVGGAGTSGTLPLVLRGVGPTLGGAPFNVPGVLGDPVLSVFPAGSTTPTLTNDDWGGTPLLSTAFASVGAFALPAASRDSAALLTPAAGGFVMQVTGKGGGRGTVIAEVYDAAGSARTATTPRLTNLSTLTAIPTTGTLAAGFVIGGSSARTVLVRAAGPTLGGAPFGLSGTMTDPRLEIFNNNTGAKIAENDNWQGASWLASTHNAVGAFAFAGAGTKDAAVVITLPPGAYSARVSGLNGGGGTAIIEVYEVP